MRDHDASLCFTASIRIPYIQNLETMELLALLCGLQLYLTRGITHLLVKSDCQLMVNVCNSGNFQHLQLGINIGEIRRTQHQFHVCSMRHAPREHNVLAHTFARYIWQINDIVVREAIPDFSQSAYWFDCSELQSLHL